MLFISALSFFTWNHICEIDTALDSTIESDTSNADEIENMSELQSGSYSELYERDVDMYRSYYGCGGSCCDLCLNKYRIASK